MINIKQLTVASAALSLLTLSACATRLADFTAVAVEDVENLSYKLDSKKDQSVTGKACSHSVFLIPIPTKGNKLQNAIQNAIDQGNSRGIAGDLLVNVKVEQTVWSIPPTYGQDCVKVEGDLVQVKRGAVDTEDLTESLKPE